MNHTDHQYIELAEIVHKAIIKWDPVGLIAGGAPTDEYDNLEKRFLSGLINSEEDDQIIQKVKSNLQHFGLVFEELDEASQLKVNHDIQNIIRSLRKQNR